MNFLCSCQLPDSWWQSLLGIFIACGASLATLNAAADVLYTQGRLTQSRYDLELAGRLFPLEQRFRDGLAELAITSSDDEWAIGVLRQVQVREPWSPIIAVALMLHYLRAGDSENASKQFALVYRLAPHSDAVAQLLTQRRADP